MEKIAKSKASEESSLDCKPRTTWSLTRKAGHQFDSGGFRVGGEGSNAREVNDTPITTAAQLGQRPCPEVDIVISFTEDDMAHVTTLHNDALVITTEFDGCDMKKILIDGGSSTYIQLIPYTIT